MPTTLSTLRAAVRRDLHDEDATSYRWTDAVLDRHLERAVREFSLALPREATATLTTTAGSRDLSLAALTDLMAVEAVEYPVGQYPRSYVRFAVWGSTLTLLLDSAPAGAENVAVYYGKLHTLDAASSTLPVHLEEVVATGAAAYAALEWASFATNRVNVGGADVWRQYLVWGQERLAAFARSLARYGRKHAVRARRLYRPAMPGASRTTDWGP
ncbi:MAG: hypothetical protein HY689_16150 [Chloroflexi bacterium]|nr:hypothetical protein [Chloroflexota bacterium]